MIKMFVGIYVKQKLKYFYPCIWVRIDCPAFVTCRNSEVAESNTKSLEVGSWWRWRCSREVNGRTVNATQHPVSNQGMRTS